MVHKTRIRASRIESSANTTVSILVECTMRLTRLLSGPILRWLAGAGRRDFPLSDFDRIPDELKVCDVVLVEGRSRAGDVIKLVKHCNDQLVVESELGLRTVIRPLAVYREKHRPVRAFLRPGIQNWNQFTGASLKFGFTSVAVTVVSPQTTPGDGYEWPALPMATILVCVTPNGIGPA